MNIKKYTKLSVLAFAISAVGSVHAEYGNVCIDVKNVSKNTAQLRAYDTVDAVHWVDLTGGPLRVPPGSHVHGCFKTAYKSAGVDIRVKSIYMGSMKTSGGLTVKDISAEGSYEGKAIQVNDGYSGFIGTIKNGDTLVIQ